MSTRKCTKETFAGIAKLNSEWLLEAMPLKLWLPARANLPIIGSFMDYEWLAYAMSWSGMLYDLTIPLLLYFRKTRLFAYITVVVFHVMTWYLFQIGMFPWIMIVATLIFFEEKELKWFQRALPDGEKSFSIKPQPLVKSLIAIYLLMQLTIPLRHWFFEGNVSWNEQGYRFSWNVMRVEKTGYIEFHFFDPQTQKRWIQHPREYLTPIQEKQMAFQPDMILQYAHFLSSKYPGVEIYADAKVSLNGQPSRQLTDTNVNLAEQKESIFSRYEWVMNQK